MPRTVIDLSGSGLEDALGGLPYVHQNGSYPNGMSSVGVRRKGGALQLQFDGGITHPLSFDRVALDRQALVARETRPWPPSRRVVVVVPPGRRATQRATVDLEDAVVVRVVVPRWFRRKRSMAAVMAAASSARFVVVHRDAIGDEWRFARLVVQLAASGVPCALIGEHPGVARLDPALVDALAVDVGALVGDHAAVTAAAASQSTAAWLGHVMRMHWDLVGSTWMATVRPEPMPLISVAIVVRDPDVLTSALTQIAAQDPVVPEVVVALHGGTEAAVEGARHAMAAANLHGTAFAIDAAVPRGAVLNAAAERCSGGWLATWEPGDRYGPRHVADLVAAARRSGASLVGKAAEFTQIGGVTSWCGPTGAESMAGRSAGGAMLIRRHTLIDAGGFPPLDDRAATVLATAWRRRGIGTYRTHGFGYVRVDGGRVDDVVRSWRKLPALIGVADDPLGRRVLPSPATSQQWGEDGAAEHSMSRLRAILKRLFRFYRGWRGVAFAGSIGCLVAGGLAAESPAAAILLGGGVAVAGVAYGIDASKRGRAGRTNPKLLTPVFTAPIGRGPVPGNPLVTVVVTAHNQPRYIVDTLRSVSDQTWERLQVVVVDDVSTDDTLAIAKATVQGDPRFSFISHEENKGVAGARNTGLRAAEGEFITFLDGDDCLFPGAVEIRLRALTAAPDPAWVVGTWCDWQTVPANWKLGSQPPATNPRRRMTFLALVDEAPFVPSAPLLRTAAVLGTGGFDETLRRGSEDFEFWSRLLRHGYVLDPVPYCGVAYRQHRTSMFRALARDHAEATEKIMKRNHGPLDRAAFDPAAPHPFTRAPHEYELELAEARNLMIGLTGAVAGKDEQGSSELVALLEERYQPYLVRLVHIVGDIHKFSLRVERYRAKGFDGRVERLESEVLSRLGRWADTPTSQLSGSGRKG